MLDERLLAQIDATTKRTGLHPAILEKDYYVTKVINSLADIADENFELIFCGGTCLSKAHKIVQRMSEDIDFKIKFKHSKQVISKSKFSKLLRTFRDQIAIRLNSLALTVENIISRNEGKYYKAELIYDSVFATHAILRPYILVEFTVSDIRLATESLPVHTLIDEALNIGQFQNSNSITSISSVETAIEKWVALTRKVSAMERGYYHDDPSLIRHVYDLTAINNQNIISPNFYHLAIAVIFTDIQQFQNQHPEYAMDPCAEINNSLQILKNNPLWLKRYEKFLESMVFGSATNPTYQESIATIEILTNNIIKQFNQEDFELLLLAKSSLNEKSAAISVNLEDI